MNTATHNRSTRRRGLGQSMMEAIIACGIITTAVSSALTLVQASISAEKESEMSIVATNLAREGLEVIRAMRDSNWLADVEWDQGLQGGTSDYTAVPVFAPESNAWSLDFGAGAITDPMARVYRYTTGSGAAAIGLMVQAGEPPFNTIATPFYRLLTLDAICDNSGVIEVVESGVECTGDKIGIRARSTVQFKINERIRSLEVEENLYNWR